MVFDINWLVVFEEALYPPLAFDSLRSAATDNVLVELAFDDTSCTIVKPKFSSTLRCSGEFIHTTSVIAFKETLMNRLASLSWEFVTRELSLDCLK